MSNEPETEAQSNQFIGWYEGYHQRDAEIGRLRNLATEVMTGKLPYWKLVEMARAALNHQQLSTTEK